MESFISPDGKSVRVIIAHDGDPMTPEGIARIDSIKQAAKEAIEGTPLDRIYWFFSLDYAGRRQYSEDTATNIFYEQMATRWGNWAKLFFNNKGVAHGTDVCMNYPPSDPAIWNW